LSTANATQPLFPVNGDITLSPVPQVHIVDVTPAMAAEWLTNRNNHNRKMSASRVATYIAEMRRGDWQYNGDPIRFDINGTLLDGQHRLSAVVGAAVTARFVLATGLPTESQDTMDQGGKRNVNNMLDLRGVANPNHVAAVGQMCWGYANDRLSGAATWKRGTPAQVLPFIEEHLESLRAAVGQSRSLRRMVTTSLAAAGTAYWVFARADADAAREFWSPLLDGVGLAESSPILLLRSRLIREAGASRKLPARDLLAVYIKAWNAWLADQTISLLVWKDSQPFPKAMTPAAAAALAAALNEDN